MIVQTRTAMQHLTAGVLFEEQRTTLVEELMEIRGRASAGLARPTRGEILRSFAPA